MTRLFFTLVFLACFLAGNGQEGERNLAFYMETARRHSPLLQDYRNRESVQRLERERLKSLYTRSRLELNGEYLFVPVISKDGGRTSFQWNAQDGTDYYGYDLGESSGHLHAGFTWTQPLLGRGSYRAAEEQVRVQAAILSDDIRLEEHQLERAVAEQYLLCLLDKSQMDFADSIGKVLERQESLVRELARNGMAAQSDLHLLAIERAANCDLQIAARQSYRSHLSDLNLLCGIADTATVELAAVELRPGLAEGPSSLFLEQYRLDSLSVVADLNFFKAQYKPQLNLFVDGGLRVSEYARVCRHFGWSAGLTFSWTIFDGRQKRWRGRCRAWRPAAGGQLRGGGDGVVQSGGRKQFCVPAERALRAIRPCRCGEGLHAGVAGRYPPGRDHREGFGRDERRVAVASGHGLRRRSVSARGHERESLAPR